MIEETPPEKGKGLTSYADKALISQHRQPHLQTRLTSEEIRPTTEQVKTLSDISGEILGALEQEARP